MKISGTARLRCGKAVLLWAIPPNEKPEFSPWYWIGRHRCKETNIARDGIKREVDETHFDMWTKEGNWLDSGEKHHLDITRFQ